jgi:hypothetical protein
VRCTAPQGTLATQNQVKREKKKKEKEQCQQGGENYMRKGARKIHCTISVDEEI